jgi:P27 family predicted phage terminase small subunit
MQGRKPTPASLKRITGNPGRRPIRPELQPERGDLPEPPEFLTEDAKAEWWRVAPELHHLGLLTVVDLLPFAAYCQAFGRWRAAERAIAKMADAQTAGLMIRTTNGNAVQNPLVGTANKAASDMVKYAAEFGLTPSKFDGLLGCPPNSHHQ